MADADERESDGDLPCASMLPCCCCIVHGAWCMVHVGLMHNKVMVLGSHVDVGRMDVAISGCSVLCYVSLD